jgi:hypothetical protein
MERIYLLIKKIINIGLFGIFSFGGCLSGHSPTKEYFVGEWKSQYDEILILNKDNSFIVKGLKTENLYRSTSQKRVTGEGKWEIKKEEGLFQLHLIYSVYIKDGIRDDRGHGYPLYIRGSGFLGNKPPWKIHSWDADDFDYNVFKKVK